MLLTARTSLQHWGEQGFNRTQGGLKGDLGTQSIAAPQDHGGYKHLGPSPPVEFCSISLIILAPQSCGYIKGGHKGIPPSPGHLRLAGAKGTCLVVLVLFWVH